MNNLKILHNKVRFILLNEFLNNFFNKYKFIDKIYFKIIHFEHFPMIDNTVNYRRCTFFSRKKRCLQQLVQL